jgi:hypothetical protein
MVRPIVKTLAAGAIAVAVFSVSFLVFYKRAQKNLPRQPLILTSAVINQPLPKANLINISGKHLADEELRRGRILLIFIMPDCNSCDQENEFLKTVVNTGKGVNFIYIIPFGNKEETLKLAHEKYALEPFFDEGSMLARKLQLRQLPIKVFVEDGIIKRTWIDAILTSEEQSDFNHWLTTL